MILRVVLATIAGGIVFFGLGFLIFGLALSETMKTWTIQYPGLMKEPPNFIALGLANLAWAFLLAVIFECWANIRTFSKGAVAGAIIMFITVTAIDLQFKAFMALIIGYVPIIVDALAGALMGGVAGGVIAAILGAMNKEKVSSES